MASFISAELTGDLAGALDKFEKKVTEKVLYSGAASMAHVIYEEVKINVSGMKLGLFPGVVTGNLLASIYWVYSPESSTGSSKTYRVSWNHKKAPHGHLLEYGTSRAPAHPFVRPAFDHVGTAITRGMERMKEKLAEIT